MHDKIEPFLWREIRLVLLSFKCDQSHIEPWNRRLNGKMIFLTIFIKMFDKQSVPKDGIGLSSFIIIVMHNDN